MADVVEALDPVDPVLESARTMCKVCGLKFAVVEGQCRACRTSSRQDVREAMYQDMKRVWDGSVRGEPVPAIARLQRWLEEKPGEFMKRLQELEEEREERAATKAVPEKVGEAPIVDAGTGRMRGLLERWLEANKRPSSPCEWPGV